MKKQIGCKHKKKHTYGYALIGSELNLCDACEKKLRKQIIEQDNLEKNLKESPKWSEI